MSTLLIKDELKKYGIEIENQCLNMINICGIDYRVPDALQGLLGLLKEGRLRKGPHIFFDRYEEGQRFDYNSLTLILDTQINEEFDYIRTEPYLVFAQNGQYSNYMIRLDDDQPDNPVIYYLEVEEYEEKPRIFPTVDGDYLRLLALLQKSKPICD
jgi:hypothetical protein